MKKLFKYIIIVLVVLFILGIAAVAVSFIFLDKIVKKGIETVAPTITQTTVTLDGVHVSILGGSVSLKGLVVGNPQGYTTPEAISVGKASVEVVPNTIMADKIVVHSILVDAPEVTFEGNPFGDNNLTKIEANVNSSSQTAQQTAAQKPANVKSSGAAKKMEVDDFQITNIKIHASLKGVPGLDGKTMDLPIPDIHLSNLGTGTDGITAAELTQKVLSQISSETVQAVADSAKSLGGNVLNGATKGLGNGASAVKQGLGGLFNK